MLSDDVLLAMFDFYVDGAGDKAYSKKSLEGWQSLVHVCRRWRSVVFESPRRLNLRRCCTPKTRARDMLGLWPALPLVIWGRDFKTGSIDNITAMLGHRDRVFQIDLWKLSGSRLKTVLAAMKVPFPELTHLDLRLQDESSVSVPRSFLGGSAPSLRSFRFNRIPFPGLPKLLLSATHLVDLRLHEIPYPGYTPEVMVTTLSMLTHLRSLSLTFRTPEDGRTWEPRSTRAVLSILTFSYKGNRDYFDDMAARIDVPRINELSINVFGNDAFETPQLIQFIYRTPTFYAFKAAHLLFLKGTTRVELHSQTSGSGVLIMEYPLLEEICTSCLPLLSSLEDLHISEHEYFRSRGPDYIENTRWLPLLDPFTPVKNLYLSERVAKGIVPALQDLVGARTTEVLPTLQNIFLEGPKPSGSVQEGIEQFVSTRQVAGHPIAVSCRENPLLSISGKLT
jgi:hypothetical protein